MHYKTDLDNAYWDDQCFCMMYGDGGKDFKPLVALDVTGHEMTHGVTSRTAGLIGIGEAAGLNESTSDIMGSMVEFYANNPGDPGDYTIGEMVTKTPGAVLRYMYQPSKDGHSADCWTSKVGILNEHYSSGVGNHFFYMLAEGTAPAGGPASKTCQAGDKLKATGTGSLIGIGRDKATKTSSTPRWAPLASIRTARPAPKGSTGPAPVFDRRAWKERRPHPGPVFRAQAGQTPRSIPTNLAGPCICRIRQACIPSLQGYG